MTHETVTAFVATWRESHPDSFKGVAEALVNHCLDDLESTDNVTVVFVQIC
jgi:hypothetical protein